MKDTRATVLATIRTAVAGLAAPGKTGRDVLQPAISLALRNAGLTADEEDSMGLLASGMHPWRSKDTGLPEPTSTRRRIDIVVYQDGSPVALIETESDLDDLRPPGIKNRRSGHYDVHSLAADPLGHPFESYKSLERMAAAAYYWSRAMSVGRYPTPSEGLALLEAIRSRRPEDHNPGALLLVLVAGRVRQRDPGLLAARLSSLGAHLVAAS